MRSAEQIRYRDHAVETAGYWFMAARHAQSAGKMADALLYMENAYNHTEGALVALRKAHGLPLIDTNEAAATDHDEAGADFIARKCERHLGEPENPA